MAKLQNDQLSSFSELVHYGRDKATTAFKAAQRVTFAPIQDSLRQPFASVASHLHDAKSMSSSRLKSLASTVFQGKGATAMSGSMFMKKGPILGVMFVALAGVAGYWGYDHYSKGNSRAHQTASAPVYQYQTEKKAEPQASPPASSGSSSFFGGKSVGDLLSLKKSNPNVKKVSSHSKSSQGKNHLKKKGHQGKQKASQRSKQLTKKKSKNGIQKASQKKHGSHKGGQLSKKKKNHKTHLR